MCSLIRRSAPASPKGSQGTGRPCIRFLPAWPFVPRPRRAVCLPLGEGGSGVSRKPETDEGLSPRRADCFPPGKPGARAVISLRRCGEGHPEKQTTIAKQTQSWQADVQHPLVPRRAFAPFASAPAAPGCRGGAPPRSFPGFSRARETGPPEANHRGKRNTSPARRPVRMDHTRDNCISVRCVPSSGAPRQLPPREARVLAAPASGCS